MPCFVYIIGSTDRTYCGWTTDLDKRLKAHNNGTGAKSTRSREWTLLYAERYQSRGEAMSREWTSSGTDVFGNCRGQNVR